MAAKSKNQESPQTKTSFLSPDERTICSQIAGMEPPYSARAAALLALDDGANQAEAGRQTGLTYGQVHYWLGKFRKEGISVFPEELLDEAEADLPSLPDGEDPPTAVEEQEPQEVMEAEETAEPSVEAAVKAEDAPKAKKKAKKTKKSKKTKKTKKAKKPKEPTKPETEKNPAAKKKGKKGKKSEKKSKKKKGSKGKKGKKKNKK